MDTISLRAYYSEIESMIERGRTKDAIVHCRHILKTYPKSIDTYRLMGKAYLEAQRFSEGADVLQRVLSAVPDDFVSQIGLSIIREDEGNLDAALWHMERAFEAQPSNKAVQDELRRLYGRRDGVQPTKIRLTRGALVRMYARGELYQQAIAEARMALVEQPDRVDIELILARMYFLSNQKISATEICSRILTKLPFCYEANKILTEVLPGTARENEIDTYRQRLYDLDPYLEFTPPGSTSSANAPEDTIMIEPLELDEAKLKAEHPELVDEEKEQLPEWLAALETKETFSDDLTQMMGKGKEAESIARNISKTPKPTEPVVNEEDEIPEWMKEAGWEPAEEAQEETENITEEVAEEIASEAEIPEWLQSIAPSEESSSIFGTDEPAEDEEDIRWLESILDGEASSEETVDDFKQKPEARDVSEVKEAAEPETDVFKSQDIPHFDSHPQESAPRQTEDKSAEEEISAELQSSEQEEGDVPDWLAGMTDMGTEAEEEPAKEPSVDSDWLKSFAKEEPTPAETEPSTFSQFEIEPEQPAEAEPKGEKEIDPDWLKRLPTEDESSMEFETPPTEAVQALESEPEQPIESETEGQEEIEIDTDWLKRLPTEDESSMEFETPPTEAVQPLESEPEQPIESETEGQEEIEIDTDWLKRLPAEEEASYQVEPTSHEHEQPSEVVPDQPEDETKEEDEFKVTPNWLERLPLDQEDQPEEIEPAETEFSALETADSEEAGSESEDQQEDEKFPVEDDWLKRLAFDEEESPAEAESADMEREPQEIEPEPLKDEDEIEEFSSDSDWLKHLSSEEEAQPEALKSADVEKFTQPAQTELEEEGMQQDSSEAEWDKPSSDDELPGEFDIYQITEETEEIKQPSEQPSEPAEEEDTLTEEEQEASEIFLEETELTEPLTAEEFLSEIEEALPSEQGDTQPTNITPPPFGGEPIEDFIAKLEEPQELASETEEIAGESQDAVDEAVPEELELSAAELEDILPESVADDNFDRASDSAIPDWLKESLDIDETEPQSDIEGETPDLAGIPGVISTKTPEELALEEILAAPEEFSEEETEESEPTSRQPEEVSAVTEESIEGITSSDEEEDRGLLSWLAEDSFETETELEVEEEEAGEFVPPAKEESEWVKEEPLTESVETTEQEETEFPLDELEEESVEETPEEEFEEVPDWLMAMAEDNEPQPEIAETKEEAIPEWLMGLEEPEIEELTIEEKPQEQLPEQSEEDITDIPESAVKFAGEPVEPTVEETLENQDIVFKTGGETVKPSVRVEPVDEEPFETPEIVFKAEGKPVEPAQKAEPEDEEAEEIPEMSYQEEGERVQPVIPVEPEEPPEEIPELTYQTEGEQIQPVDTVEEAEEAIQDTSPQPEPDPLTENISASPGTSELYNAQAALNIHDLETALSHYNKLIERGESLEEVIHDLREALDHYPVDITIWQALGDAYMRGNQLQEALNAYTKAEELMR